MRLRGALIGCGAISKKHLKAFEDNQRSFELVAVCDVDQSRINALGIPAVKAFNDYRIMLGEIGVDFVTIATSSSSHYQIASDCLQAGCHVILEKPISLSTDETNKIVDLSAALKRVVAVCYITRFAPHMQALSNAVVNGNLGRICNATLQVNWNRNNEYYKQASWRGTWDKDGGTLMNQCTHGIDLLDWVMNDNVKKIHGVLRKFQRPIETEDFGAAILEYENGGIGLIQGSVNVYPMNHDETLGVFGENGTVVIGGKALNEVVTWEIENDDRKAQDFAEISYVGHSLLYEDFASAVSNGHTPLVSAEQGKRSVDIVLGIYKAMATDTAIHMPVDFSTSEMKEVF